MIECMDWKLSQAVSSPAIGTSTSYPPERRRAAAPSAFQVSAADEGQLIAREDAWRTIQDTLIEMGHHPERFSDADERLSPPSHKAIQTAYDFAKSNGKRRAAPPDEILPDGDGGITIRLAMPDRSTLSFEAAADGGCSLVMYRAAPSKPVVLIRRDRVADAL